jgi:hypothetical protein
MGKLDLQRLGCTFSEVEPKVGAGGLRVSPTGCTHAHDAGVGSADGPSRRALVIGSINAWTPLSGGAARNLNIGHADHARTPTVVGAPSARYLCADEVKMSCGIRPIPVAIRYCRTIGVRQIRVDRLSLSF